MIHLQRKQSPLILFLPHDALQSTVTLWYVICSSVRPSVTFVYHGHIVLTFLKITTKISFKSLLPVANKHWSAPRVPKFQVERKGVKLYFGTKNRRYVWNGSR